MEPSHSVKSTAVPPVVYQELPLNAEAWLPPMLTAARAGPSKTAHGACLGFCWFTPGPSCNNSGSESATGAAAFGQRDS